MKTLITFLMLILSQLVLGADVANYNIKRGLLHSGGTARAEVSDLNSEKFVAKLIYDVHKKLLVPIPGHLLKGETIMEFPPEFRDERGYMELETKGTMELEKVSLKFVRRVKWKDKSDAYEVLILPKNGKSKITAIYHPSIPAAGWAKVSITFINNVPIFNGYEVTCEIK
jgi:hypothetical protein